MKIKQVQLDSFSRLLQFNIDYESTFVTILCVCIRLGERMVNAMICSAPFLDNKKLRESSAVVMISFEAAARGACGSHN